MKLRNIVNNPPNISKPKGISNVQWSRALRLYEAAKNVGDKFPELTVAQAALETGWFKKESGKNNFFGQKATKNQKGSDFVTHEVFNGERVKIKDRFRDYDSIEESLKDRKRKWMSKYDNASNVSEAISSIWKFDEKKNRGTGYATDPKYGDKLQKILGMMNVSQDTTEKVEPKIEKVRPEFVPQPIDNTRVNIPSLANTPLNPTYASLEETGKKEEKKSLTEKDIRKILEQERGRNEQNFAQNFFKSSEEPPSYSPESVYSSGDIYSMYQIEDISKYADGGVYKVKRGDSLSKIAKRNNISLDRLLELNSKYKSNPNLIRVGDSINLGNVVAPEGQVEVQQQPKYRPVRKIDYSKFNLDTVRPDISRSFSRSQEFQPKKKLNLPKEMQTQINFSSLESVDDIKRAQKILYYSGYDLGSSKERAIDGKLGRKTRKAIEDYKKALSENKFAKAKEKGIGNKIKNFVPLSARQFIYDSFGGDSEVNETNLSDSDYEALKSTVIRNIGRDKMRLDYDDWREARGITTDTRDDDMNLFNSYSNLQKTLGQASIKINNVGDIYVEDTYNFNDAGAKKNRYKNKYTNEKGLLPIKKDNSISNNIYRLARNYKTVHGRSEGGSPVKIYIGNVSDIF